LDLPDADRDRLFLADIGGNFMFTLEFHLQEPDDAIVLELLADRPHQNRAHATPRDETVSRKRLSANGEFNTRAAELYNCGQCPEGGVA
jgi:hypothetical protein